MSLDKFFAEGSRTEPFFVIEYPDFNVAVDRIKRTWRTHILIIFGYSRVFYEGRAKSRLSWADHLVITKPDGTLLIHGKTKREPVNWQPPGCVITVFIEGDFLVIRSKRIKPLEIVRIEISNLYFLIGARPGKGRFDKFLSESQMVDFVIRNPEFIESGFTPIQREAYIKYGYIDLLGKDADGNLVVLEFKRRRAEVQDVAQLSLYVEVLQKEKNARVRGILVAPDISWNARLLLREKNLEFRRFDIKRLL